MRRKIFPLTLLAALLVFLGTSVKAEHDGDTDLPVLTHLPATPTLAASTIPPNGDVNPYGVAFVPKGFPEGGPLHPGNILISNFNGSANLQGTGTTVVSLDDNGQLTVFFQGPQGLGLSTALAVMKKGFVVVGNLPSTGGLGVCTEGPNGEEQGAEQGSLIFLDSRGKKVRNLTSAKYLDGPWDMTIRDEGNRVHLFVSEALSGKVARIDLRISARRDFDKDRDDDRVVVEGETIIASGYTHRCDPAAFVVGPTGLALDLQKDILYVASTGDNAIYAIHDATDTKTDHGTGTLVVSDPTHMHGPLGLVRAANGDLISTQGDAINPDPAHQSEIVEYTSSGTFVSEFSIDPLAGSAFGMALESSGDGFRFAAVDDGINVLDVWEVR